MKTLLHNAIPLGNQRGVTIVIIAIMIAVFIGFAALAIDISHLYVVRNEIQNAADAGALAGARVLYDNNGTAVNPGANQAGHDAAEANRSEQLAVEVNWTGGNSGDVQRGHWSFTTRTFTPNASLLPVDLWNVTSAELDANTDFINAVRVTARREASPAASFFATIFGHQSFIQNADAVAYIGFAGTLQPFTVDQPIAICKQAILSGSDNTYTCGTARMMNANIDTAAWTDLVQPCQGAASASDVRPLVCAEPGANPRQLILGMEMSTTNGQQNSTYKRMRDCWIASAGDTDHDGIPDQPWPLLLPVIDCPGLKIGPCHPLVGAVEVTLLWMTEWGGPGPAPRRMEGWTCPAGSTDAQCWNSFVAYFNLRNYDDSYAGFEHKSMYLKPSCVPHIPQGNTGGENYGILARIPVLVR